VFRGIRFVAGMSSAADGTGVWNVPDKARFDKRQAAADNREEPPMKKVLMVLAVVGLSASLAAQSVVDLAKREKERRESLKGRHAVVVTNADLLLVKKTPAVEVVNPGEAGGHETQAGGPAVSPPGAGASQGRRIVPRVSADGPEIMSGGASIDQSTSVQTLEAQLQSANDLVDLLTTKMNALRQQFEFQDAMVPGYVIQQQIDETFQRLVKAQAQQARIQAEMDKRGLVKKDPGAVDR